MGDAPGVTFSSKGGRYDPMKQGTPGNVPSFLKNPGPGTYTQSSAFGHQLVSHKSTAPSGKIGSTTRQQRSKLYYSQEHEKEWRGMHSPGPHYLAPSSIGAQVGLLSLPAPTTSPLITAPCIGAAKRVLHRFEWGHPRAST